MNYILRSCVTAGSFVLWLYSFMAYLQMQYFNFNGKLYKNGTPVIGAGSRGLRYGDGLFETIKCLDNRLLFADEHLARLWKGMQVLQFDVPKHFTPEGLLQETLALVQKNEHAKAARVRITVFRGDGGIYDPVNHFPNYIIQTWPLPEDAGKWNSNGLVLGIYTEAKKSCDILSGLKHNNYLPYVMAALEAKKQKWNDAILLNNYGRICDSTIANIFYCKDETVYTPALSEGCVAGTIRKYLIGLLKDNGMSIVEKEISIAELMDADEVFVTNAIANIRWVYAIDDKVYTNVFTQKIFRLLPTIS